MVGLLEVGLLEVGFDEGLGLLEVGLLEVGLLEVGFDEGLHPAGKFASFLKLKQALYPEQQFVKSPTAPPDVPA